MGLFHRGRIRFEGGRDTALGEISNSLGRFIKNKGHGEELDFINLEDG